MDKIFTQKKSEEVYDIQGKPSLMHAFENCLMDAQDEPEKNVVTTILNYSKVLESRKSKHIDYIEIILN